MRGPSAGRLSLMVWIFIVESACRWRWRFRGRYCRRQRYRWLRRRQIRIAQIRADHVLVAHAARRVVRQPPRPHAFGEQLELDEWQTLRRRVAVPPDDLGACECESLAQMLKWS